MFPINHIVQGRTLETKRGKVTYPKWPIHVGWLLIQFSGEKTKAESSEMDFFMLHLHSYTHSTRMCWVYVCARSPLASKLILSHFRLSVPLGCVCVWVQASLSTFGRLAGGWIKVCMTYFTWMLCVWRWRGFKHAFLGDMFGGTMCSLLTSSPGWIPGERPPKGTQALQFPVDKAQPRVEEITYLLYLCVEYREI